MTYSKEQLTRAFIEVLGERVPDLSQAPDHVFSARFEKRMNKLIDREASHPWAVSHTLTKNLIAAVIVILLLFALCMSVGAIREAIFNFFIRHFEDHDDVVFEIENEQIIAKEYRIASIPAGFSITDTIKTSAVIRTNYENENGDFILLEQKVLSTQGTAVDNERSRYELIEINGRTLFSLIGEYEVSLAWDQDGYEFWLTESKEGVTLKEVIDIYNSIELVNE